MRIYQRLLHRISTELFVGIVGRSAPALGLAVRALADARWRGRYSLPKYPSLAAQPAVEQQKNLHATVIKACWKVTDFELFFAEDPVISPASDLHMQRCFAC